MEEKVVNRSVKLVVADDDPLIRRLIGSILKRDGYEVCLAANGTEAIAMTHEVLPDLVILDYMMPDLDGGRVAAVLKAAELTRDIPILLLSALDEVPVLADGESSHPWDHRAEKPFTPAQLKEKIAEIVADQPRREPVAPAADEERCSDIARPMRHGYAEALRNTVAEMQVELDEAHEGRARATVLESVRRRFHQIRGSAATFGFPGIGEVAAEAEAVVRDWLGNVDTDAAVDLDHVRTALERIGELLKSCEPSDSVVMSTSKPRVERDALAPVEAGRILLLHNDRAFVDAVSEAATKRGYELETFDSPIRTLERLREQSFSIITIGGEPGRQPDCEWARFIRRESGHAAVVLLGGDGSTEHRVTAAKAGVDRYVAGEGSVGDVIQEWEDLCAASTERIGRVMVVDDDPAVLQFVEANLRALGCEVVCLDDAVGVFESLEESEPDLLILDVDMPAANGLEVTRAIRASDRWVGLPIVIQTAHTSPEYRLRAFESGADDFITKPILEEELSSRVLGRLERERVKHELAHTDPVTGLYTRERFTSLARRSLAESSRGAAAVIEIEGMERLVKRHGPASADAALETIAQALRGAFRSNKDLIGRLGPHVIALVAPGASVDEVAARVETVLEQLEHDSRLCPSGNPSDGLALDTAILPVAAADDLERAFERALGCGRPRERSRMRVERSGDAARSSDVFLVEDDPSLREMLAFALDSAGYRVRSFDSGHEALRVLTRMEVDGERPLVLLDVELPGIDGFEVLEELVLERPGTFRVVMLTASDGSQQRMRALRSGATDFIAKPLSIPDLLSKVGRMDRQAEPAAL